MPTFDLDAYVGRSGAVDLRGGRLGRGAALSASRRGRAHDPLHAGHREPHHRLPADTLLHACDRRPRRGHVPRLLALRGDVSRPRPARGSSRRRVTRFRRARAARSKSRSSKRLEAAATARRVSRAWPDFCRRAHDVGRDQRADHAHRLSPPGGGGGASGALPAPRSHRARRVAAFLLLLSPGRDPARASGTWRASRAFWSTASGRRSGSGVQPARGDCASSARISSAATKGGPPRARWTTPSAACPGSRPSGCSKRGWTATSR